MPTAGAVINTDTYTRVNIGQNPITLQAHRDAVRLVFSDTQPARSNASFHLLGGDAEPMTVEYNDVNLWALATSEHSKLVVTEFVNGYLKIRDELTNASLEGSAYAISGSWTVAPGESLAMILSPASDIIVHKVTTNPGCEICVYDMEATGTSDGIFNSGKLNFCSSDVTATQAQLIFDATATGALLACGVTLLEPHLVACQDNKPSFVVKNETASNKDIRITVTFEKTSTDAVVFGLLPSTNITPTTEMSIYG